MIVCYTAATVSVITWMHFHHMFIVAEWVIPLTVGLLSFLITIKKNLNTDLYLETTAEIEFCPSDISVNSTNDDQPICQAIWREPSTTDDGSTVLLMKTHSPGFWFPAGSTIVNYVFKEKTNSLLTCSFTVSCIISEYFAKQASPGWMFVCVLGVICYVFNRKNGVNWTRSTCKTNSNSFPCYVNGF